MRKLQTLIMIEDRRKTHAATKKPNNGAHAYQEMFQRRLGFLGQFFSIPSLAGVSSFLTMWTRFVNHQGLAPT